MGGARWRAVGDTTLCEAGSQRSTGKGGTQRQQEGLWTVKVQPSVRLHVPSVSGMCCSKAREHSISLFWGQPWCSRHLRGQCRLGRRGGSSCRSGVGTADPPLRGGRSVPCVLFKGECGCRRPACWGKLKASLSQAGQSPKVLMQWGRVTQRLEVLSGGR